MAGIKLINTLPETFRFPEWRSDIYYAPDSVVRYAQYMAPPGTPYDSDALVTKLYIAQKEVNIGSAVPPLRLDLWSEVGGSAAANLASVVAQIVDNDSDILWLRHYVESLDSEDDSDELIVRIDYDSDLKMTYHDWKAADSDIINGFGFDYGVTF